MGRMVTNPATRKMPLFLILSLWPLVPYPVIVAATKGDPDAMKIVLQHFSGYIARLSMRKLYDERGNVYFGVDHDIRERLQAKLMMAVLTFKAEE